MDFPSQFPPFLQFKVKRFDGCSNFEVHFISKISTLKMFFFFHQSHEFPVTFFTQLSNFEWNS